MVRMSKTLADSATAFKNSAGTASTEYQKAIPTTDPITPGTSPQAQANYVAKMTNPTILAKRLTNLQKVTVAAWRAAALAKGVPNINTGITNGSQKYQTNFSPFYSYISDFQTKPKTTNATTNIQNNLIPLAQGLQDLKNQSRGT